MTVLEKQPELLIEDYTELHGFPEIRRAIINNYFSSMNQQLPMCRFRGTVIDKSDNDNGYKNVIGWQRNVSRIRKMDVSLPTLICLTLNDAEEITEIELDSSFRGSKGLLCSHSYLNKLLKSKMIGLKLDTSFLQMVTMDELHCFHLVEVLGGIFSYYRMQKNIDLSNGFQHKYHYEEEVMDCFLRDGDCYACSKYVFKDRDPVYHTLKFNDVFRTVCFDKAGNLKGLENVNIDFFINDALIFSNGSLLGSSKIAYRDFLRFIMKCTNELRTLVCDDRTIRFLNTNLTPGALIGLIAQVLAMQTFKNNYNYVMHVLTALQRPNNVPICLGATKNQEEADRYFSGYDFENLLP